MHCSNQEPSESEDEEDYEVLTEPYRRHNEDDDLQIEVNNSETSYSEDSYSVPPLSLAGGFRVAEQGTLRHVDYPVTG